MEKKSTKTSYSDILKSSAIVGGAQGIDIVIRALRVKIIAILLGPSGVGLIGLFQSTIDFVGNFTRIGIGSSAVRHIAEAKISHDIERLGRAAKTLSRASIITAILGWTVALVLAKPLSVWTFGSSERAFAFGILGLAIFFTTYYENQIALLQGVRRIKDIALVMVLSSLLGSIISISLYGWKGEAGIIIALPAAAAINYALSYRYAKKLKIPKVTMSWRETGKEAIPILKLGLAFMWSGMLHAGIAFMIKSMIIRNFSIDASGIYQAAWGISGLFAGFILKAMGKDFYPRLSAVAKQDDMVNKLVNEQIEVGILIALPGLLATLAFSEWAIQIFYTAKFFQASELLTWFVMGIFGRVVSWPMGFIQLAKGESLSFTLTETIGSVMHLVLVWLGMHYFGLEGVAVAFVVLYIFYIVLIYCVVKRLSSFKWTRSVVFLCAFSVFFIALEFSMKKVLSGYPLIFASLVIVLSSGVFCLKQLLNRLEPEHKIVKSFRKIPVVGRYV